MRASPWQFTVWSVTWKLLTTTATTKTLLWPKEIVGGWVMVKWLGDSGVLG